MASDANHNMYDSSSLFAMDSEWDSFFNNQLDQSQDRHPLPESENLGLSGADLLLFEDTFDAPHFPLPSVEQTGWADDWSFERQNAGETGWQQPQQHFASAQSFEALSSAPGWSGQPDVSHLFEPDHGFHQFDQVDVSPFTQVPQHNLHLAYHAQAQAQSPSPWPNQSEVTAPFGPGLPPASPDFDLNWSPEPDDFSDDEEFTPAPDRSRAKGKGRAKTPSSVPPLESRVCQDCHKMFKKQTEGAPDHCQRCAKKLQRRTAGPPVYTIDPSVPNIEAARPLIYPRVLAKGHQPLVNAAGIIAREDEYIQRFLDAINTTIPNWDSNDKKVTKEFGPRQQIVMNGKARLDTSYTSPLVTARLRALFSETFSFHAGAARPFYATGGDNAGYSDDVGLTFEERIEELCKHMANNKRIAMDVIEGRGVQSFVGNPRGYAKRKAANNECNGVKKEIMEEGKRTLNMDAASEHDSNIAPSNTKGRKRKTTSAPAGSSKKSKAGSP